MPSTDPDYDNNKGYRIELTIDAGCEFNVELHAH
jgi:hypothetical protein